MLLQARPYYKEDRGIKLCKTLIDGNEENAKNCTFAHCIFVHEIEKYLKNKLEDIGKTCYIFTTRGYCRFGLTCRFSSGHLDEKGRNIKLDSYDETKPPSVLNQISNGE